MNKKFFYIFLSTLIFLGSRSAFSATQTVSSGTFTAIAVSTGTGTVSLSIQLQTLTGGTTSQIWWDTSKIFLGTTQWQRADACIILYSNITSTTGAVQIYTDNSAPDANPQFQPVVTSTDPAGLVDTSSVSATLPMCWRITDSPTTTLTIMQTSDNQHLYSPDLGSGFWCFLFMRDKGSSGINMGDSYLTVKQAFSGIQYAESNWSNNMQSPNYIYLGANFSKAGAGRTYKTSTLRIEAFSE